VSLPVILIIVLGGGTGLTILTTAPNHLPTLKAINNSTPKLHNSTMKLAIGKKGIKIDLKLKKKIQKMFKTSLRLPTFPFMKMLGFHLITIAMGGSTKYIEADRTVFHCCGSPNCCKDLS
jgi:hypothetical protein